MPEVDLRRLLIDSRESEHWGEVADRCLTCGNCTMVCPTCFCTSAEDITDLAGEHAERWTHWASCFRWTSPSSTAVRCATQVRPGTGTG